MIFAFSVLATPTRANDIPLLLEVRLNNRATGLIVRFIRNAAGELSAAASELAGLRLPVGDSTGVIPLSRIPGLIYRYDAASQSVAVTIAPDRLAVRKLDAAEDRRAAVENVVPGRGAFLSYNFFAASEDDGGDARTSGGRLRYSGASVALDGRLYSGLAELRQTSVVTHAGRRVRALRLDTTVTRILPTRGLILVGGDGIGSGAAWSRPIRFSGLQAQHSFAMRPDLVTMPLPSVSGSALVPSSLDLYVNGARTFSAPVGEGRFQVDNLPGVTGNGEARVVLRDIQGRVVETVTPFFVSGRLLRAGLSEYSVQAGVPRQSYGVRSFDHSGDPFISASGRVGLARSVTLDGHAELSPGLLLAGGGATMPTGRFGVVSAAAAGSVAADVGGLVYVNFESGLGQMRLNVESQRTIGDYTDLATISAVRDRETDPGGLDETAFRRPAFAGRPANAVDRISVSAPVPWIAGNLSVGYAHEQRRDSFRQATASLAYSRTFSSAVSLNVSAYGSVRRESAGRSGVFAGLSLPLGGKSAASFNVSRNGGRGAVALDIARSVEAEPGSVGWRLAAAGGDRRHLAGGIDLRTRVATFRAQAAQNGKTRSVNLSVEGGIVADGGVFLAPRVDRSFAIVDAGAPGVPISYQNRPVGRSGANGLFLVGDTRPFERNIISIDPSGLPANAVALQPVRTFRPAGPGGVRIGFAVDAPRDQAVVRFVDERGVDMPVGATIRINGSAPQAIGFDGLVLATGLKPINDARVDDRGRACSASFAFSPVSSGDAMATIGPVQCRTATDYAASAPSKDRR